MGTFVTGEEGGWRDVVVLGDCDGTVVRMCKLCDWEKELGRMEAERKASHHTHKYDHTH